MKAPDFGFPGGKEINSQINSQIALNNRGGYELADAREFAYKFFFLAFIAIS